MFKTILMKIWSTIKSIFSKLFKWIFNDIKNIILICIFVFGTIFFIKYKHIQYDYDNIIIENTLSKDSISVYKNKIGELYTLNNAYITDIKNIKQTNLNLYNEIKNLKDNPITVEQIKYIIQTDTIIINSNIKQDTLKTDTYHSTFNFKNEWVSISGNNIFNINNLTAETKFNDISFNGTIYSNLIEKNGQIYIIAKSDNPYFKINNLNSYVISPEESKILKERFKKPWGISAGIGCTACVINSQVKIVPGIQLTLGYQFIRF